MTICFHSFLHIEPIVKLFTIKFIIQQIFPTYPAGFLFHRPRCSVTFVVHVTACRWTFHSLWSCSRSGRRRRSSSFKCSALACGALTSTGTTVFSRCSCSSHSRRRSSNSSYATCPRSARWATSRIWYRSGELSDVPSTAEQITRDISCSSQYRNLWATKM